MSEPVDRAPDGGGRRGVRDGMLSAYVLVESEVGKVAHVA